MGGNCKTSIEPFESSEFTNACYEDSPGNDVVTVYTVEGESWTDSKGLLSAIPVTGTWPQTTGPFTNPWTQETAVVVARNMPAIPLVFKASDVEAAKNDTKDEKDGDGKDDKNDATSRQPKLLGLAPMAALVVGALTGAGLLMPW